MEKKSFHLISLGCAKNQVDSEVMLGSLTAHGWSYNDDPASSQILLLNTCGFIQPAVEEAIEEILALAEIKAAKPSLQKLVVAGCMVQRYGKSLAVELPEVDLFVGCEGADKIPSLLADLVADKGPRSKTVMPERSLMSSATPRMLATPPFRGWLKITEGCSNHCSYCMIPSIRGPLRSRTIGDLKKEAIRLAGDGMRELSLVAQDSTAYGRDLGSGNDLVGLLRELLHCTDIAWFRLLYLYPTGISNDLLALMAENRRILPYLDIPFQHVNDAVLKRMNRPYGSKDLRRLLDRLRAKIPDIALRTTFMVGFPGETEEQFLELADFMTDARLDHVGVFAYTNEEGAASYGYEKQIDEREKIRRRDHLLKLQAEISATSLKSYLGQTLEVLVEGLSGETDLLLEGRSRYQAPEVDGCIYINEGLANPGDIVPVRITKTMVYDLVGGIIDPNQQD